MKNYIYVFYNKLSCRYETVMAFPSDDFAIHQFQKMKVPADEYDICRIGSIGIEDGIVETCAPIRLAVNVESTLPTSSAE